MFDVGRVCIKIAGRDAGKSCVIVQNVDANTVLIDGQTRRRNCNLRHLEPTDTVIELKAGASHEAVKKAVEQLGMTVLDTKKKTAAPRPKKVKAKSEPVEAKKPSKKAPAKKASKKEEPVEAEFTEESVAEEPSAEAPKKPKKAPAKKVKAEPVAEE